VDNVTPKSENFHSQLTTFNYHSETPTCESELSLTTWQTLTQWGENSHSIRWELSLVMHTPVKTPTNSSGKHHSIHGENFHPQLTTFT